MMTNASPGRKPANVDTSPKRNPTSLPQLGSGQSFVLTAAAPTARLLRPATGIGSKARFDSRYASFSAPEWRRGMRSPDGPEALHFPVIALKSSGDTLRD